MERIVARFAAVILATVCAVALAPPGAASAASLPFGAARQIVLVRAGGFAGGHDTFVVDRATAGGAGALRLAGSARFRWLRGSYQPKNPCCDRFTYRITVTYRGGHRKSVSTVDGAPAPKILWDVIAATQRAGARPAPA